MKEEIERISNPYALSFICSFGYKPVGRIAKSDRMDDQYILKSETGEPIIVARRDFFTHVKHEFGGVLLVKKKNKLNPLISYDMFFNIQI